MASYERINQNLKENKDDKKRKENKRKGNKEKM